MYMLLLAVILIWSLIIVRFLSLRNPNNKDIANQPEIVNRKQESSEKTDFQLLLNYTDPFFVEKNRNQSQKDVKNNNDIASKKVKRTKLPVTTDHIPTITYSGMIFNPTTEKKVGFIRTGRKQYLVEVGDHVNNLEVINLWNDSIRIKWNEKVIDIKRDNE
ncbi:hypothetical protein SLH46_21015 [Draconibacterium sp. IB214405]|nr:hypothetical protein [Draconibacterium sp. IB214405]